MDAKSQEIKANTPEQLNSSEQTSDSKPSAPLSVAEAVVKMLEDMEVQYAFGVLGGAIAPLWYTLQHSASAGQSGNASPFKYPH